MKLAHTLLAVPATAFALLSFSSRAHAAATTATCTVGAITYDEAPRLMVQCADGSQYYTFLTGTAGSCQSRSLDTIKTWETMLLSVFLSGKHVTLTYEPASSACGTNSLYAVTISP
jgi:hypothetical protein